MARVPFGATDDTVYGCVRCTLFDQFERRALNWWVMIRIGQLELVRTGGVDGSDFNRIPANEGVPGVQQTQDGG